MTDFNNIKTQYVRNKLKELEYNEENRNYINSLMVLERYHLGEPFNGMGLMLVNKLENEYNMEYREILKEVNPEGLKEYLEELRQSKKKREEIREQSEKFHKEKEELSRKSWEEVSKK